MYWEEMDKTKEFNAGIAKGKRRGLGFRGMGGGLLVRDNRDGRGTSGTSGTSGIGDGDSPPKPVAILEVPGVPEVPEVPCSVPLSLPPGENFHELRGRCCETGYWV